MARPWRIFSIYRSYGLRRIKGRHLALRRAQNVVIDEREVPRTGSQPIGDGPSTALVEVPTVATSRDDNEIKIVGDEPRVIAEVVKAASADTTDFIDMVVETFHRETGLDYLRRLFVRPAVLAGLGKADHCFCRARGTLVGFAAWVDVGHRAEMEVFPV